MKPQETMLLPEPMESKIAKSQLEKDVYMADLEIERVAYERYMEDQKLAEGLDMENQKTTPMTQFSETNPTREQ